MPMHPSTPDSDSRPEEVSETNGDERNLRSFAVGLLVGIAATGVVFILIRAFVVGHGGGEWIFSTYHPAILLLPVLGTCKIAIAVGLLCVPKWKAFGKGLLASVGIGVIVFFGMCAFDQSSR